MEVCRGWLPAHRRWIDTSPSCTFHALDVSVLLRACVLPCCGSTAECVYASRVCSSLGNKVSHAVVLAGHTRFSDMSLITARKGGWLDVVRPDWQRLDTLVKYEPTPADPGRATYVPCMASA
jgi:hypothetical protein